MSDSIKNYSFVRISSRWGLLLEILAFFDLFLTPMVPKKGQKLWFVLNEWHYKICYQKLYLCANFKLLGVIFRGMGNFWPFWSPLAPRMSLKKSQNMWFHKNKCHNQISHTKLCIYVNFQLIVIILLEMTKVVKNCFIQTTHRFFTFLRK